MATVSAFRAVFADRLAIAALVSVIWSVITNRAGEVIVGPERDSYTAGLFGNVLLVEENAGI